MPVVRSIQQRKGGTALVGVDNADPVELPLEALLEHNLHENRQLEPERWTRILEEGRPRVAVRRSLEFLAKRRRTRAQLREHLENDFDEAEVARAVARVEELGYLDDSAWARSYIAQPRSRGRGRSMLTRELRTKGIGDQDLETALAEHDEHGEAIAAARKRLRALRNLEPDIRERRLYSYLQRRGFRHELIREAMATATAESAIPTR